MVGKSIWKLSRSKAPKCSKLAVTDILQKPDDLLNNTAWAPALASAIVFKIQVRLQKFPFLNYNSLETLVLGFTSYIVNLVDDINSTHFETFSKSDIASYHRLFYHVASCIYYFNVFSQLCNAFSSYCPQLALKPFQVVECVGF